MPQWQTHLFVRFVDNPHSAKSSSSFALGTKTQTLSSAAQLVRNALMKVSSANAEPNTFNSKRFRFYWDDKPDVYLYGFPVYAKVSGKLKIWWFLHLCS